MIKLRKVFSVTINGLLAFSMLTACSDDSTSPLANGLGELENGEEVFGKATGNFTAEEWFPGGALGTTENASYSAITPAAEQADMTNDFTVGEDFFEHLYTFEQDPRKGLGPAWVRNSCIACHPSYGHGKRQTEYRANQMGNGYLLVIYHPDAAYTTDGVRYTTEQSGYISEVTGMPQTQAMAPFKAPIDENQIKIEWKQVSQMPSGLPMTFEDGEQYSLIYPEVTIPVTAFNTNPLPTDYEVRLESTIGIYGTGLILQDGAGANAIWNITNVTRSDRHWLYTTTAWAKAQSEDADVISYIKQNGASESSLLHPYYADGTDAGIQERVYEVLNTPSIDKKETFEKYLLNGKPYDGKEEMSDKQYYQFMVWHRGLAVPAARNLNDAEVQRGKLLFSEIGCAQCHRPSWKTGADDMWVDASIKAYAASIGKDPSTMLPKYPNQTIWPYTDMVQHRLFMENDIRTGWCRTTPLWGRGLSRRLTGADDRLHDCRARSVVEAIMWHGYSKQSQGYRATEKFYHLNKADRRAIVRFIESI